MSQPSRAHALGKERTIVFDTTLRDGELSTGGSARTYVDALDERLVEYAKSAPVGLSA